MQHALAAGPTLIGLLVFAALFAITMRRGATDPVCGMSVDKAKALRLEHDGATYYFCPEHCQHAFQADPNRYSGSRATSPTSHPTTHAH